MALLTLSGLGACGDDGDGGAASPPATTAGSGTGSGEEKVVRGVVQEAITTTDPSACTELVERALIEQTTGERGQAAVKACRDDADEPGATSLKIDAVRVSGPRASADIRPKGGNLPFKTVTIGLRKSGGRWKVSRLKSGVVDRDAFFRVLRRELAKPPNAVPAALIDCAAKDLESVSDSRLADAYLKPEQAVFLVPVVLCSTRAQLQQAGIPEPIAQCINDRLERELKTGAVGRRLAADPSALKSDDYESLGQRFAAACARSTA